MLTGKPLVVDREYHPGPFATQAEQVLRWRDDENARPDDWRARARANIAFPGLKQPRGPLQKGISEVFDSDRPPFFKQFLEIRCDGACLEIRSHWVRGQGPEPAPYAITIGLAAARVPR